MKRYPYILLLFLFVAVPRVEAQRIVRELETNTGQDFGIDPDSTYDETDKKTKKVVPAEVYAWTVDPIFGNRTAIHVDTIHHLFQNSDHPEGIIGEYTTLANIGLPRLSRIFADRRNWDEFIYVQPLDQFVISNDRFRFYNTKSPYMNLTYNWCGSKQTGDDHFRATYTNNAGKRINFGGIFDYMYGQGYYDNQSTSLMGGTFFASYIGDRYDLHLRYTHNYIKQSENGGIEDEIYITNPEVLSRSYGSKDIPTNLSGHFVNQEHDLIFLNHRYHVGFTQTVEVDSATTKDVFVPVAHAFHTFTYENHRRTYRTTSSTPTDYYTNTYLPFARVNDRNSMVEMQNLVGLTLNEGFNKYAVASLSAYLGYRHRRHLMPDTIPTVIRSTQARYTENDVLLGGQLIRTQGTRFNYNAQAQLVVAGDNIADLNVSGQTDLHLPIAGDTAAIALEGKFARQTPNFYYDHHHSTYAWWDNSMRPVTNTTLAAHVTLPRTQTHLHFTVSTLKNYAYFADVATIHTATPDDGNDAATAAETHVSHQVQARQYNENIHVLALRLQQNFRLGIFHLDNDVTYQTTSHSDVLPLPTLTTHHNFYIAFKIAKVLSTEVGADMTYFTKYYVPDYSPAIGQFVTQSNNIHRQIGNYPLISAYANLHLKRCRFYIQYYHINQGDKPYFWAPLYPMNPAGLHMGISWNFYD